MKKPSYQSPFYNLVALWLLIMAVVIAAISLTPDQNPLSTMKQRAMQVHGIDSNLEPVTGVDQYWNTKKVDHQLTTLMGVKVSYGMTGPHAVGWTTPSERSIVIDPNLEWNARLVVLSHEAGHIFAPSLGYFNQMDDEAFADGVAYMVCVKYRFAEGQTMAVKHVAMYKGSLHVLQDYRKEIEYAAYVLTGR